jgi:hypothetical protein
MLVPPYQLRSGLPYCASLPKSLIVCGDTFPKSHAHDVACQPEVRPGELNGAWPCRLIDQNG